MNILESYDQIFISFLFLTDLDAVLTDHIDRYM